MKKLERTALSWMRRLALMQTNGCPTGLTGCHCPINEIGGSELPHISEMTE